MKNPLTAAVATAISLLLNSAPVAAGEPQFRAPSTARAQESAELLRRTAYAVYGSKLTQRGAQISNLWLYPTGDPDTVFAQYTLKSNKSGALPAEHLALLTVRDDRIVQLRELTDAAATSERSPAAAHWSAAIGTGQPSNTTRDRGSPRGVPVSPHWTAAIGTGNTARSTSRAIALSAQQQESIAEAHWTSRIGTGHAAESDDRPPRRASTVAAETSTSTSSH